MTTWKDGGDCGRMSREITNENESRTICAVRVRQGVGFGYDEPWPEGEANFRLILQAPQMLAALEAIAKGAIVSPEQPPEQIAEQTLRVLQMAREAAAEYMMMFSVQQRRANRTEEALCSIRDQAECVLQPLTGPSVSRTRWEVVRDRAVAAIEAVKGENDEKELV